MIRFHGDCFIDKKFDDMGRVIEINGLGPLSVLANDLMDPIVGVDGITYKSVCHAYYSYLASGDPKRVANVRAARNIADAQEALGIDTLLDAQGARTHCGNWKLAATIDIMRELLRNKMLGSRWAREALMATYGSRIVVVQGNDKVLGVGKSRSGLNVTGLLLMELRDYYVGRGGLRAPDFAGL